MTQDGLRDADIGGSVRERRLPASLHANLAAIADKSRPLARNTRAGRLRLDADDSSASPDGLRECGKQWARAAADLDDCVTGAHVRSRADLFPQPNLIRAGSAEVARLGPLPGTRLVPPVEAAEVVLRSRRQIARRAVAHAMAASTRSRHLRVTRRVTIRTGIRLLRPPSCPRQDGTYHTGQVAAVHAGKGYPIRAQDTVTLSNGRSRGTFRATTLTGGVVSGSFAS